MRIWHAAAAALALAGSLAGCDDYLEGPELTSDPNTPSVGSINQLYHGVQLAQYIQHTGDIARHVSMWTQQMAGIGNQLTGRGSYTLSEQDLAGSMDAIYLGGGLYDMREIRRRADEAGDEVYGGIIRVWEAYLMAESASLWGAMPYSEAVADNPTPALDPQERIYAESQRLLDEAIARLRSGRGAGPGPVDRSYGGDRAKWLELAHTLKARFYLHWVEAQGAGGASAALASTACGGDCLQKALEAARDGISSPANDFKTSQADAPNEENLWYQFMSVQRQAQIAAGKFLVDLLRSRNDPRLTQYFRGTAATLQGAAPGQGAPDTRLSAARGAPAFPQPMVTHAENQLILAEASHRLGNEAAALQHLDAARRSEGLDAAGALSGPALLREIMLEKYIALFQNIEAWNDYKRTCLPALTPAAGGEVIGRLLYSNNERNSNPNIPDPREQPRRNPNDPAPCPAP